MAGIETEPTWRELILVFIVVIGLIGGVALFMIARARLRQARVRQEKLRNKLHRTNRSVPPVADVLPALLARRRSGLPPMSSRDEAIERERDFANRSSAYRENTKIRPDDVLVTSDNIALWLPAECRNEKIKMPWSVIQQVRMLVVGGTMLDIGANVGQTSLPRALLGDFAAIYAAEPSPENYARLRASIIANGLSGVVLPDRIAIGSKDGTLRLGESFYRSFTAAIAADDEKTFTVPCLTLDHWLETIGVEADEVSFVKTDTNGFELEVLRGAAHLISKRLAVWQIEVAPSYMRRIDVSMDMLGDELQTGFTHFIDMSARAPGQIVRPIGEFAEAMGYLDMIDISAGGKQQTDILCFNA